jgi:hypothetical protein
MTTRIPFKRARGWQPAVYPTAWTRRGHPVLMLAGGPGTAFCLITILVSHPESSVRITRYFSERAAISGDIGSLLPLPMCAPFSEFVFKQCRSRRP